MKRLLLASTIAFLASCNSVKAPFEGHHDPYPPGQISFGSQMLQDTTAVGTPVATRDENGILHVNVPIRAATNEQLYVDYRVTFLDRNGAVLSQTGWLTKTLRPNVADQIEFVSSTPRASDFHVDFSTAK